MQGATWEKLKKKWLQGWPPKRGASGLVQGTSPETREEAIGSFPRQHLVGSTWTSMGWCWRRFSGTRGDRPFEGLGTLGPWVTALTIPYNSCLSIPSPLLSLALFFSFPLFFYPLLPYSYQSFDLISSSWSLYLGDCWPLYIPFF